MKGFLPTTVLYLVSEILAKSSIFLLLPILSRALGTEEFGNLAVYLSFYTLFSILTGFSTETSIAQRYYTKSDYSLNLLSTIVYVFYSILFLISISLALVTDVLFLYALTAGILNALFSINLSLSQCRMYKFKFVFQTLLYSGGLLVAAVLISREISTYKIMFFSQVIAFIIVIPAGKICNSINFSSFELRKWLIGAKFLKDFGVNLLLHKFSTFMKDGAERLILSILVTKTVIGVYFAARQFSLVVFVAGTVLNRAVSPYIMSTLKQGGINKKIPLLIFMYSCLLSIVTYIIFIFIPASMYSFVFGEGFDSVSLYVAPLVAAAVFYLPYFFSVNILYFYKILKNLSVMSFSLGLLHLVVFYMAMILFDLKLAAYSLLLSNFLLSYMISKSAYQILERNENQ